MAQNMTLSGGNAAQNQYMNYYNQIRTQLSNNGGFTPVQAQVIEAPQQMQAQQIAAPDPIQSERIDWERQNVGQYASELDNYFKPYLENSMRIMRQNAADQRAAVDVDALSRGMSPSTWTTDAKSGIYKQLAGNIQSALSEYSRQLGEQAIGMWDSNEARALNVALSNAQRADEVAEFNPNLQNAIAQYNANALMNADEFNIGNALRVALQNAEYAQQADMYNSQAQSEWEQYLQQLAWNWAGQMANTNPVVTGGGGRRGGDKDNSGVSNASSLWDNAGGVLKGIGYAANALNNNAQNQAASAVDAVQAALAAAQARASSLTPGSTYQSTKNKTSTVAGGTKVKQTK